MNTFTKHFIAPIRRAIGISAFAAAALLLTACCLLPAAYSFAQPPPPVANAATGIMVTSFSANWSSSLGATTYYLDVSTVSTFASFVGGYNNLNVGNVTAYTVTWLTPSCDTAYYYRVRAGNITGTSTNSNTITVTLTGPYYSNNTWRATNIYFSGWELPGFNDAGWAFSVAPNPGAGGYDCTAMTFSNVNVISMWCSVNPSLNAYFRKTFAICNSTGICSATLTIGVDDDVIAYINGVQVLYELNGTASNTNTAVNILPQLMNGTNTIAVNGIDAAGGNRLMCLLLEVVYSSLTATTSTTPANCNQSDGTASVTAGSGSPAYTYSWSPSGGTSSTATGLSAGSYTVTITDATGCSITGIVANVSNSGGATASIASSTSVTCNGGNDGSATAGTAGGATPYTYSWNTAPAQTTVSATGLSAGTYNLSVTDGSGCISIVSVTIGEPAVLSATVSPSDITCNGANDGTAAAAAAGGSGSYTYIWNTSPAQNTQTATGLSPGNYSVTVTDNNGCAATQTVSINEPAVLSVSVSPTDITCNGANDGTAAVAAAGGSPGYTFLWSTSPTQNTQTATGLSGGNYTVTITDNNGCAATQTVSINEPTVLSASVSPTNVTCNGANDGTAAAAAAGGSPGYTFLWSTSPAQNTQTATGLPGGNYIVTVTDSNGCVTTQNVSINEPAILSASVSPTDVTCNGGSNGTAGASASGGSPGYTYSWSTSPAQNTQTATGLSAGNYTVTITDVNGCTGTQTVSITQPAAILLTASSTSVACNGNTATATVNASGGTGGYTYLWNPSAQTSQTATGLAAGNYTATVADANGCTQTQTVTVTSNNPLTLTASSTQTGCTVNNGTATANPSNGATPYTYNWSNAQTTSTATGLGAGTYTVTVTDASGCTQMQTVSVTQISGPAAAAVATPASIPTGANTTLAASGGGTYSWTPSTGLSCTTCAAATATATATTTYCVFVTDGNGCTNSACVTVDVFIEPLNCDYDNEQLFVPDFFSPNGDTKNDALLVYYPDINCIKDFKFVLYDRWGEKVFETTDITTGWDGAYKGKLMNTAVFVYYMKVTFITGNETVRKGNVSLIR